MPRLGSNARWLFLIQVCDRRGLPVEVVVQWRQHLEHADAAKRAAVIRELIAGGARKCEVARMLGMTRDGIKRAVRRCGG